MPLPLHPLYKQFDDPIPVSLEVWNELVTLPLYVGMTDDELNIVIDAIKKFDF